MVSTTTAITKRNTRQKQINEIVSRIGGPLLLWVCVSVVVNDEVGIAYGVAVTACGMPAIGTYVGTKVGVG